MLYMIQQKRWVLAQEKKGSLYSTEWLLKFQGSLNRCTLIKRNICYPSSPSQFHEVSLKQGATCLKFSYVNCQFWELDSGTVTPMGNELKWLLKEVGGRIFESCDISLGNTPASHAVNLALFVCACSESAMPFCHALVSKRMTKKYAIIGNGACLHLLVRPLACSVLFLRQAAYKRQLFI